MPPSIRPKFGNAATLFQDSARYTRANYPVSQTARKTGHTTAILALLTMIAAVIFFEYSVESSKAITPGNHAALNAPNPNIISVHAASGNESLVGTLVRADAEPMRVVFPQATAALSDAEREQLLNIISSK